MLTILLQHSMTFRVHHIMHPGRAEIAGRRVVSAVRRSPSQWLVSERFELGEMDMRDRLIRDLETAYEDLLAALEV